ncbi:MAG TPA: hypothetical protein V6C57_26275 [Coleofasciculaceae cyanobacterium]
MSLQQFKAKLLAVSLFTVSACGTFAIFGSVPVIAKIASAPPFSIDKIEAFLRQQTNLSPASIQDSDHSSRLSLNSPTTHGNQNGSERQNAKPVVIGNPVH